MDCKAAAFLQLQGRRANGCFVAAARRLTGARSLPAGWLRRITVTAQCSRCLGLYLSILEVIV